jgi:hypothetical protein
LTDAVIANERYRGEPSTDEDGRTQWPVYVVWDDDVQGLGVRIHPPVRGRPSRKDFVVTWRAGLKSRTMAIGTYGVDCTLRQARRYAREALDLARRGQDPIEVRQRALGIGTTEDLASRFLFEHSAAKKKPIPGGEPPPAAPTGGAAEIVEPPAASPVAEPLPEAVAAPAPEASADPLPAASADPLPAVEVAAERAGPPLEPGAAPREAVPAGEVAAGEVAPAARSPVGEPPLEDPRRAPEAPPRRIESSPAPRRGPTRLRLLSVPDALHREIERRARASGLTIAAYLQVLLEREAGGSVAEGASARVSEVPSRPAEHDDVPSPKDVFARVQASQTADVAARRGADSLDDKQGRRGD